MALLSNPLIATNITGHETLKAQGLFRNKGIASSFTRKALGVPPLSRAVNRSFVVCAKAQQRETTNGEALEEGFSRSSSFPPGFVFGAATAAYQIEGAADIDGRGKSIWDTFTHKFPDKITGKHNGDVAADSYHRYKEDVQLLKELGMDAYRFSISWSRILPNGRGEVNEQGVKYYKNLITELENNNIEPYVTIFHWDVPQALEDEYNGFLGDKIVEDYKFFADVCFREFGDKVKNWITMNEPSIFSTLGYGLGLHAPGHCTNGLEIKKDWKLNCPVGGDSLKEPYIVAHNILRAHGEAVDHYKKHYKATQGGQIGITLVSHWMEPIDDSPLSKDAQERALQFNLGWFMDPLKFGEYPLWMRALVGERLPFFTDEESEKIKNSYDFIGLNYYTARYAQSQSKSKDFKPTSYMDDARVDVLDKDNAGKPIEHAEPGSWINVHPRGLRELLLYIKRRYDNPTIYITENGVMEKDKRVTEKDKGTDIELNSVLNDTHRTEYLILHLHELREALRREVDVKGYFTWSLLDNFEWHDGFSSRLGLYFIDYYGSHPEHLTEKEKEMGPPYLCRIKKQSVFWFQKFLARK